MNRFELINAIVDDQTLTSTQKMIMVALWRFSDENGISYPSITTLMSASSIKSRKAFYDNRHELVEKGYLEVSTINGKGCLYRLTIEPSNLVRNVVEPSKKSNFNPVSNQTTNISFNIPNKQNNILTSVQGAESDLLNYIMSKDNPNYDYLHNFGWMYSELSSEWIC